MRKAVLGVRTAIVTALFAGVAMSVSFAHAGAPLAPPLPHPIATVLPAPTATPTAKPSARPIVNPSKRRLPPLQITMPSTIQSALGQPGPQRMPSALGPKIPLSMFPKLQQRSGRNSFGARHKFSDDTNSMMFFPANTTGDCATTTGDIFNTGCTVDFFYTWCNPNTPNAPENCTVTSITTTDTLQDYYIDANTSTAQTVGCTYKPSTAKYTNTTGSCTSGNSYLGTEQTDPTTGTNFSCTANGWSAAQCPYGPGENLTLSNPGTVVLATYDVTKGMWLQEVYVTVVDPSAQNGGLLTYSDSTRRSPSSQFLIPAAGTNTAYITISNARYQDVYVIYLENNAGNTFCEGVIPGVGPGTAGSGECNPSSSTGVQALSNGNLNMQWTFGAGTLWTALTPGQYSLVAYDLTQGTRISQTKIALYKATSATISLTPIAGANNYPYAAGTGSAGTTRFAFDNQTENSDFGYTTTISGLTSGHSFCMAITDPDGRVYDDQVNYNEKFICTTAPGSGTYSIGHTNIDQESPLYFAPDAWTLTACDYTLGAPATPAGNVSPCTDIGAASIQMVGYNAITQFTNAAGTAVTGLSLVVPSNGSTSAGLQFVNDGDAYYGIGNGDNLTGLFYCTSNGVTITGIPANVTDSAGHVWTVTSQTGNNLGCNNTGGQGTSITLTPQTNGQSLGQNATVTLTNLTFNMAGSPCNSGCTEPSAILPQDGLAWSLLSNSGSFTSSSPAVNNTYITSANGSSYSATATMIHVGVASGCTTGPANCTTGYNAATGNRNQQGWAQNFSNAIYDATEPWAPASGKADIYALRVTNSGTQPINKIYVTFPSAYASKAIMQNLFSQDANTATAFNGSNPVTWTIDNSAACPSAATICMNLSAAIAAGTSKVLYVDIQDLPSGSFNFTDVSAGVYSPATYTMTADACCSQTIVANTSNPPSQITVDSLAVGAYSLSSSYMSGLFSPTTVGTSSVTAVEFQLTNTATSQETLPDDLDAVVVEMPKTTYWGVAPVFSNMPAGWSYLGNVNPGIGGGATIDYWFSACSWNAATYVKTTYGPQTTNTAGTSLPAVGSAQGCTLAQENNAIAPGQPFTATANLTADALAGTVTATAYGHGSNGNGWSKGIAFKLTESSLAATAGFANAGLYGSPPAVSTNSTPQIAGDTSTAYGDSYIYTIKNTSGAGNNINSAQVLIPWQDTSGADGNDGTCPANGCIWFLTPAGETASIVSSSGATNCGITGSSSATASTSNGVITVGNSGGTCTITPGGYINIEWSMKGPYKVNDSYKFPTCVNGTFNATGACSGTSAGETWTGDQTIQIVVGASLVITVGPSQNANGYAYSYGCAGCAITQATNTIQMPNIGAGSSFAATDVALVDVYTDASSPIGWTVYVTQQNAGNPTAAAYLQTKVDNTTTAGCPTGNSCISYQPVAGTSYGTTAYTAIPVTTTPQNGLVIGTTAGTTATRKPFEFSQDYQVVIPGGGNTLPSTSTVTYTFISN
ncbi:MAG TPA: hypothetical protein VGZ02_15280 [Candidatus Baltobacteraceae bacterium]|jgi:hypothetical protein|nr:hypothetical protein [Candidatus Baltobacteraceae bacterium]